MPGAAMLQAAAQTLARGWRAGWMAVLSAAVPVLCAALKIAGAAYPLYLGLKLFPSRAPMAVSGLAVAPPSPRRASWKGVTVEVLNPMTALFCLAFLPKFTVPAAALPVWAQPVILGTVVNLMLSTADVAACCGPTG